LYCQSVEDFLREILRITGLKAPPKKIAKKHSTISARQFVDALGAPIL
jgi:hypothetical protein